VGQFGEKLRRERELRGITLEEVAIATKIGTRNLRALEEEKFSQLPGGIFNKGFVRAYSRYVGIDEEQAVSDYVAANQNSTASDEVNIQVVARQFEASRAAAYGVRRHGAATLVWSLVAAFALISASIEGWPHLRGWLAHRAEARKQSLQPHPVAALQTPVQAASNSQVPPSPPANAAQASDNSLAANKVTGSQDPSLAPSAPPQPAAGGANTATGVAGKKNSPAARGISLILKAKERCWVSIQVDGKRVMEDTMDPDSSDKRERSFQARNRLVVVAGNPAGIDVTLNGQFMGRIGATNVRQTFTFTPEGIEQ